MALPFDGSGVALVTPFQDGGVNERVLAELVEFQIAEGTDALIVCGSTGEAATMTPAEQARAIAVSVEAARRRIPVIGGVGGSDTNSVMGLARGVRQSGADGILISAPPYNKPTQRGIVAHYRAVIAEADLPTIIYNVPGRTSCNVMPETIEELASDPRVIGVKEACGDISQIADLSRKVGDRLTIYSGNDDQVVPILALGGRGVISVLANIAPRDVAQMVDLFLEGNIEESRALQLRYLPIIRTLFAEPNPVPIKAAVAALGFDVGPVRLPLVELTDALRKRLLEEMSALGITAQVSV
jgi:4-hydroxy-tetrahydrodipicolinate synthase